MLSIKRAAIMVMAIIAVTHAKTYRNTGRSSGFETVARPLT